MVDSIIITKIKNDEYSMTVKKGSVSIITTFLAKENISSAELLELCSNIEKLDPKTVVSTPIPKHL